VLCEQIGVHAIRRAFPTVLILFFPPVLAGILTQGACKPALERRVGEGFAAKLKPYSKCDPKWYDWQIRWQDVYVDDTSLKFRDVRTLHSFFKYFFLQRTVRTGEVDFWDIPLLDSVARAGNLLGLEDKDFANEKNVQFYFVPSDQELVLVHIKFRPIYIEALFKKQADSWYWLVGSTKSNHVRSWQPSFYLLTGTSGKYLFIPNWYGGTGSAFHEEKLMVFDISKDKLTGIVEETIYRLCAFHSWSYLTSTMKWNPRNEQIAITKETVRGQLGKKQAQRKVVQVTFDLRKTGKRTENLIVEEVITTTGTHKDYRGKSPQYKITVP